MGDKIWPKYLQTICSGQGGSGWPNQICFFSSDGFPLVPFTSLWKNGPLKIVSWEKCTKVSLFNFLSPENSSLSQEGGRGVNKLQQAALWIVWEGGKDWEVRFENSMKCRLACTVKEQFFRLVTFETVTPDDSFCISCNVSNAQETAKVWIHLPKRIHPQFQTKLNVIA